MEPVTSGSIVKLIPDTYHFKWFISNPHIFQRHKKMKSPSFVTGANNENTWRLELYNTCELFIYLQDCKDTVKVLIQIYSSNEEKTMEKYYADPLYRVFKCISSTKKGVGIFLYRFPELRELCRKHGWKLPHNQLTIIFEIQHELKRSSVLADDTLLSELSLIFKNGENSDVKIVVGRKEFRVHKFMLATRSSVFSTILKHNVMENQQNIIIEVTDVDYDTMEKLLEYIYTGRVTNIDEAADKLLIAADIYALEGLKCMCSNTLIEKISTENLCEMFKLAVKYQVGDLKAEVLDYISLYKEDDMPLDSLKEIHPYLE